MSYVLYSSQDERPGMQWDRASSHPLIHHSTDIQLQLVFRLSHRDSDPHWMSWRSFGDGRRFRTLWDTMWYLVETTSEPWTHWSLLKHLNIPLEIFNQSRCSCLIQSLFVSSWKWCNHSCNAWNRTQPTTPDHSFCIQMSSNSRSRSRTSSYISSPGWNDAEPRMTTPLD